MDVVSWPMFAIMLTKGMQSESFGRFSENDDSQWSDRPIQGQDVSSLWPEKFMWDVGYEPGNFNSKHLKTCPLDEPPTRKELPKCCSYVACFRHILCAGETIVTQNKRRLRAGPTLGRFVDKGVQLNEIWLDWSHSKSSQYVMVRWSARPEFKESNQFGDRPVASQSLTTSYNILTITISWLSCYCYPFLSIVSVVSKVELLVTSFVPGNTKEWFCCYAAQCPCRSTAWRCQCPRVDCSWNTCNMHLMEIWHLSRWVQVVFKCWSFVQYQSFIIILFSLHFDPMVMKLATHVQLTYKRHDGSLMDRRGIIWMVPSLPIGTSFAKLTSSYIP